MIDLTQNGEITLTATEAYTESELNGAWSATIIHPIDALGRWEYLTEQAVIKMNSWNGEQLYRIAQRTKTDTEVVCTAYPIFYDAANDCFLTDIRPTEATGQQALNLILSPNSKYTGVSDISTRATAYYQYRNALEAIAGEDNSFLNRWGGEVEFDNYTVKIKRRMGTDNNLELRYGKNISEISENVDMNNVITRIYPKAYNGRKKTGVPYVDSPNINAYPVVKAAAVTFDKIKLKSDAQEEDLTNPEITICKNQSQLNQALSSAAQAYFDTGADKPNVSVTVYGVADLAKLPEYAAFNQSIGLGDTVQLIHSKLNIRTEARINYIKFDSLRDQVQDINIGDVSYNYFRANYDATNKINAVVRDNLTVRAESVSGVMDMKETSLYAQYDIAEQQNVLGILFENNDSRSPLYGAMALGTAGFMIADQKDADGNWIFNTLGTAKGIVATFIKSGILSSMDGASYWDLDNSKLVFTDQLYNSQVVLDEGFIQFLHNNIQFGKLLRAIRQGQDILEILTDNGLWVNSGGHNTIKGPTNAIDGTDLYLTTPNSSGDPVIHIGNANGTHSGYSGSFTVDGKTIFVHGGIITQVS